MTAVKSKCKALCCDKNTSKRYCRKHRTDEIGDTFGEKIRPLIAALPGAAFEASYLDDEEHGWRYTVPTSVGKLTLTFHAGDFSLYGRFEDPARACALLGGRGFLSYEVNPYSGKWNHHYDDAHPIDDAVQHTLKQLKRVIPQP